MGILAVIGGEKTHLKREKTEREGIISQKKHTQVSKTTQNTHIQDGQHWIGQDAP